METHNNKLYAIKTAAQLSGLTPFVIRAWEKRYHILTPTRKVTNHRLYTPDDIEKLSLLNSATQLGHRIGNIAHLDNNALLEIIHNSTILPKCQNESPVQNTVLKEAIDCVRHLEPERLEQTLVQALFTMSQSDLIKDVIAPLAQQMGEDWHNNMITIAHEHIATAVLKKHLLTLMQKQNPASSPLILVGTPMGQHHELGALMVATLCHTMGWRTLYFGNDTPTSEIVSLAYNLRPRAIALSIVYPRDDQQLKNDLMRFPSGLALQTPIFIGGASANSYQAELKHMKATSIESLDDMIQALKKINMPQKQKSQR